MKFYLLLSTLVFTSQTFAFDVAWELLDSAQRNRKSSPSYISTHIHITDLTLNVPNETEYNSPSQTLSGNNWSQSSTPDLNKYFEVTFTPINGAKVNFTTFQIPLWSEIDNNDKGPRFWTLRSSKDSYTTDIGIPIELTNSDFSHPFTARFDLTSFDDIDSALTFRLYGYGAQSSTGSGGIHIDQYKVYLTADIIPEPSVFGLALLGVLFTLLNYCRTRRCS